MWYIGFPQFEQLSFLPFYLSGIGKHDLQPPIYRPDGLPRHQFLYCEKGTGSVTMEDTTITINPGCGFYLPPGTPHEYYPLEDEWDIRWVSCAGSGVDILCNHLNLHPKTVYSFSTIAELDKLLTLMYQASALSQNTGYYTASSYVNTFIVEFAKQAGLIETPEATNENIYLQHMQILKDYIENNFMNDISLEELCQQVSVTPQHLCRIFRKCTSQKPTEYINALRLEHAKKLLATSKYPISQIARWCGFETPGYFGKRFRMATGITPKQYRLNHLQTRS